MKKDLGKYQESDTRYKGNCRGKKIEAEEGRSLERSKNVLRSKKKMWVWRFIRIACTHEVNSRLEMENAGSNLSLSLS